MIKLMFSNFSTLSPNSCSRAANAAVVLFAQQLRHYVHCAKAYVQVAQVL